MRKYIVTYEIDEQTLYPDGTNGVLDSIERSKAEGNHEDALTTAIESIYSRKAKGISIEELNNI